MKAFPLWIKPMGPSNQRSHLWPLKQLSCVEERCTNPAHGRVSGHLSGGEHQRLYAERGVAPSQLEAESSPISQLDALPCLGVRAPLAAPSPFRAGATLCRRMIPAVTPRPWVCGGCQGAASPRLFYLYTAPLLPAPPWPVPMVSEHLAVPSMFISTVTVGG